MSFIKDLKDRSKSTTPPFFKKIAKWAKIVAYASGIAAAGVTSLPTSGVAIPAAVPVILGCVTAMATTAAANASLATDDQDLIDRQYDESTEPNAPK